MTTIDNELFVTNGENIYRVEFGENYLLDVHDLKFKKIFSTECNTLRIYSFDNRLTVRDVNSGQWWAKAFYEDIFELQPLNTEDFVMSFIQPEFLIGFNNSTNKTMIIHYKEDKLTLR